MIRSSFRLSAIVLLSFMLGRAETVAEEKQAAYICHAATSPIIINGQLDEPAWRNAPPVNVAYPFRPKIAKSLPKTTARLLWDERMLYVAWKAEDTDIWSYSDTNDDTLWRGDIVELYIKPSSTSLMFYEIDIAPNGAIFDGRYPSRGAGGYHRFQQWNSDANVATHIDGTSDDWRDIDRSYTVEAAIPLKAFSESGIPKEGAEWTFGLFRCDFSRDLEAPLLFSSLPGELDPTHGFHSYERYQPMVFKAEPDTRK